MRFLKKLALVAMMLAIPAAAIAGNTSLFSSTIGDVTFPLSPPTNAGATPGRLDNTAIGTTTPAPGAFTTLSASTGLTGPVAATTLSASGAVTGAGFTARFATPGAIGSTVASTGAFTSLSAATLAGTGSAPAPTGTGTPTITSGSTNLAGEVTAGASATSVVITFNGAPLSSAPFCTVSTQTGGIASFAYATTSSAITVTQTATSGNKINYICATH